jgi:hypothetical protein
MQTEDKHSTVPGGADASKRALRSSCAWHRFLSPWGNASHWLMQTGDRHSAVPGGRMLAKVSCLRHVPGTDFGDGTDFGAAGTMLAIA